MKRSSLRMRLRLVDLALLALGACLLHCADLPHIDVGTCGNGVVEQEEDCDSFPADEPDAAVDPTAKKLACGTSGASACRYVCTTSAECPSGWGCSVAGICRAPTGNFPKATEPLSAGVVSLVAGDFDGDGRKDLLASGPRNVDSSARARVHFFGDGAALERVTALAAPLASPAVRDFDGDGLDDFAFGVGGLGAFGIFTGQSDRTFIPVMFPLVRVPGVDVKPVQVRAAQGQVLPSGGSSVFLLAGKVTSQKASGNFILSADSTKGGYLRPLPVGVEGINGSPVTARLLDADPTSACGEVVLAFATGEVHVFSPCKPDGQGGLAWANDRAPIVLTGMDPTSTVFAARVDEDPHVDLIFRSADKTGLHVAYGTGTGFADKPPNNAAAKLPGTEVPLAAADITGDGAPEFVTPSTIISSATADGGLGPPTYTAVNVQRRSRWTMARIGNLNGDAYPDIIAASADQPDIDFFSGGPNLAIAPSTIPTDGPVSFLSVGDFDGDTVADVVFVEGKAGSNTTDVSIAYGRPFGSPEEPRTAGRLADISFIDTVDPGPDTTLRNLAIFLRQRTSTGDPQLAIAFMTGSGDRQPLAPLFLTDGAAKRPLVKGVNGASDRRWSPVSVHAGTFADPKRVDLIAIAIGYTYTDLGQPVPPFPTGVWGALGTGDPAAFGSAVDVADLGARIDAVDRKTLASLLPTASGDVDGDGLLDTATIGRTEGDARPSLVIAHLVADAPQVDATPLGNDVTVSATSVVRLLDVDQDGKLDVVAVLADPANPASSKVLVYFNDGKGGFGAPPVPVTPPPQPPDAKKSDSGPVDVALVTTGAAAASGQGSAKRQLAVLTQRRLLLATLHADRGGFDVKDTDASGIQAGTGIVAADVDGDGVEDLAIADNGALRVYRQKALHDKEAP